MSVPCVHGQSDNVRNVYVTDLINPQQKFKPLCLKKKQHKTNTPAYRDRGMMGKEWSPETVKILFRLSPFYFYCLPVFWGSFCWRFEFTDPIQTCLKMYIKYPTLKNNICLIWFFHTKKVNYLIKILKMTSPPFPSLEIPEYMNIQI